MILNSNHCSVVGRYSQGYDAFGGGGSVSQETVSDVLFGGGECEVWVTLTIWIQ